MNLELEAYEGELKKLRELNELYKKIFIHSFGAERIGDVYFICGEMGQKDKNGLPDKIMVCPAYGVDWFQVYEKTDKTHGPEW